MHCKFGCNSVFKINKMLGKKIKKMPKHNCWYCPSYVCGNVIVTSMQRCIYYICYNNAILLRSTHCKIFSTIRVPVGEDTRRPSSYRLFMGDGAAMSAMTCGARGRHLHVYPYRRHSPLRTREQNWPLWAKCIHFKPVEALKGGCNAFKCACLSKSVAQVLMLYFTTCLSLI